MTTLLDFIWNHIIYIYSLFALPALLQTLSLTLVVVKPFYTSHCYCKWNSIWNVCLQIFLYHLIVFLYKQIQEIWSWPLGPYIWLLYWTVERHVFTCCSYISENDPISFWNWFVKYNSSLSMIRTSSASTCFLICLVSEFQLLQDFFFFIVYVHEKGLRRNKRKLR